MPARRTSNAEQRQSKRRRLQLRPVTKQRLRWIHVVEEIDSSMTLIPTTKERHNGIYGHGLERDPHR
jgi:hypothetical protein